MMIGLHDADLIYRNENVHESEKMAHHLMVCYVDGLVVSLIMVENYFKKRALLMHANLCPQPALPLSDGVWLYMTDERWFSKSIGREDRVGHGDPVVLVSVVSDQRDLCFLRVDNRVSRHHRGGRRARQ